MTDAANRATKVNFQTSATEAHHDFGARVIDGEGVRFSVWAPLIDSVELELVGRSERLAMQKVDSGFHQLLVSEAAPGDRYFYRLDGGSPLPDPASRFQPDGVHGPSAVVDPAFEWNDSQWRGRQRDELIIYELHVGAFTDRGTFEAAIDRLDELVDLGVTAIELMPIAASAGNWNWGYDGVALFAPFHAYGTPDQLRRLVDAAHSRGLAVFLDVVYNHVGPEGNYLNRFGPYLSSRHATAWGDAPNFDCPEHGDVVRRFFIANALHWIDEYHLDGLRVDAIHCMTDDSDPHIAADLSRSVSAWSAKAERHVMMIAESNVYDPEMLQPLNDQGIGFDAMWCDDFLHSVFAVLRPGEQLASRRYQPKTDLVQTLRYGYVYEGTLRQHRQRRRLNQRIETHGLIYSIQNHDFIGNHPLGGRLHQITSHQAHRAAAALLILSPAIPMLFMGEEFACDRPFCFFVDFSDPLLRQSVVDGRRREYPQHDWDQGVLPTDPIAFESAKIGARQDGDPATLRWYQSLIGLRHRLCGSGLLQDANLSIDVDIEQDFYCLRYQRGQQCARVYVRLSDQHDDPSELEIDTSGEWLLDSRSGESAEGKLMVNHAVIVGRQC